MAFTTSKEDAIRVLKTAFGPQITIGRIVGEHIIRKKGSAHVGDVYAYMKPRNLIPEGKPLHWLGCVFRGKKFKWTQEKVQTNIGHDTLAKVWVLADAN